MTEPTPFEREFGKFSVMGCRCAYGYECDDCKREKYATGWNAALRAVRKRVDDFAALANKMREIDEEKALKQCVWAREILNELEQPT